VKQLQCRKRKTGEEIPPYIVPLPAQAMEIVIDLLDRMTPSQRYLLRNRKDPKKCLCESALNKALKNMGYEGRLTGHGIRGTFSTAFNEIGYPDAWIEAQCVAQRPERDSRGLQPRRIRGAAPQDDAGLGGPARFTGTGQDRPGESPSDRSSGTRFPSGDA
jgi:hypothetical protein